MYPARINDLFVGRPVIVTGRFQGSVDTHVTVTGTVQGKEQRIRIPVDTSQSVRHPGIACVWARKKIEMLNNQANHDTSGELPEQIKDTALAYNLMSAYTAFIAVDSSRRTAGDHGVSVAIPVPVPDGVRYETTVSN